MNPLRHDFIRRCRSSTPIPSANSSPSAPPLSPDERLRYLDIGCGGGIFAESAARLPTTLSVTAIDPSPGVLAIARSHAKKDPLLSLPAPEQQQQQQQQPGAPRRLTYRNCTIESLPLPPADADRFDVVSVFEVIEHVDYPSAFLDRAAQFVKPDGGWLVLSTIARTWTSWFTTNLVAEDILGVVPKGTHDWNKYINVEEMRAYFRERQDEFGWGEPRVMGVVYVPGVGWREVQGSERVGNYFLGVQRVRR